MATTDLSGYNNTGLYKLKYEKFDQNGEIQNFQSHEKKSCVPTNLTNIHCDNISSDTTTTVLTLTTNKTNGMANIHRDSISRDMTTTESTLPTNNSNDTTTTVPNLHYLDRIITTTLTTVLVMTTATTPRMILNHRLNVR